MDHDLRHLPGTEQAALVETPMFKRARVAFELLKRGSGIVALDGPSGQGKTFRADALAREFTHRVFWLDLTGQRSIYAMYARLWYKISGLQTTSTAYMIAQDIQDVLVEADCVLLIDEAQWANRGLLRTLRSIYDAVSSTRNEHTFVLIGQRLRRVLRNKEPGLHSRTQQRRRCGRCGRRSSWFDAGHGRRRWRALDLGTTQVWLEADVPRVRCRVHGVTVVEVPWVRHGARCTRQFEHTVAWLATRCSKTAITALLRVAWRTVGSIIARVVADKAPHRSAASLPQDPRQDAGVDRCGSSKRGTPVMSPNPGAVHADALRARHSDGTGNS